MAMAQKRLLRAREVAEVLGISEQRAYEVIRRGIVPSVRIGRQVRVDEEKLYEWIEQGGQALDE